jgi:hypothetical protein
LVVKAFDLEEMVYVPEVIVVFQGVAAFVLLVMVFVLEVRVVEVAVKDSVSQVKVFLVKISFVEMVSLFQEFYVVKVFVVVMESAPMGTDLYHDY